MQSRLDDLSLRPGVAPSALETQGVTFGSSVDDLPAEAVVDSATVTRLRVLTTDYGDEGYESACEVIETIATLVEYGEEPSQDAVERELDRAGSALGVPISEIYALVTAPAEGEADEAAQVLLWASCLAA